MNRVAAKVSQKIGMLLEEHRLYAGTRKKKSGHHSGRTTSDDAALVPLRAHPTGFPAK